jgi:hypothetical protein
LAPADVWSLRIASRRCRAAVPRPRRPRGIRMWVDLSARRLQSLAGAAGDRMAHAWSHFARIPQIIFTPPPSRAPQLLPSRTPQPSCRTPQPCIPQLPASGRPKTTADRDDKQIVVAHQDHDNADLGVRNFDGPRMGNIRGARDALRRLHSYSIPRPADSLLTPNSSGERDERAVITS